MVLRISVGASILIAVMSAFLFVQTADMLAPRGVTHIVTIWDPPADAAIPAAIQMVADAARSADTTVIKDTRTLRGAITYRTLYVIDPDAAPLPRPSTYPDFDRQLHTRFATFADLPLAELVGMYETTGSAANADRFARELEQRGFAVDITPVDAIRVASWVVDQAPVAPLAVIALVTIVGGSIHHVLARRRIDAIARLNGRAPPGLLLRSSAEPVLLMVGGGFGALVLSIPALIAYNDLAQFTRFALTCGLIFGAAAIAATITSLSTAAMTVRSDATATIAGRAPTRLALITAAATHGLTVTLVLSVVAGAAPALAQSNELREDESRWSSAPDVYAMSFRTNERQFQEQLEEFREVFRAENAAGDVLVASHPIPPHRGRSLSDGNSITVDSRFLRDQEIMDMDGHRVDPDQLDSSDLTLLVPMDTARSKAIRDARLWLRTEMEKAVEEGAAPEQVAIRIIRTAAGQRVFNYGTGAADPSSIQVDPVIAVLPSSATIPSADWIVSNMTTAGVMFTNPVSLQRRLHEQGLDAYIGRLDLLRDVAAQREAELDGELRADELALGVGIVIALLAGTVTAATVAARRRRREFIFFVHGARRWSSMVAVLPVAIVTIGMLLAVSTAGALDGPLAFSSAGAICILDLATAAVTLTLRRSDHRAASVRDG